MFLTNVVSFREPNPLSIIGVVIYSRVLLHKKRNVPTVDSSLNR